MSSPCSHSSSMARLMVMRLTQYMVASPGSVGMHPPGW